MFCIKDRYSAVFTDFFFKALNVKESIFQEENLFLHIHA